MTSKKFNILYRPPKGHIISRIGKGALPKELQGGYTSTAEAEKAISNFEGRKNAENKSNS